MDVEIDLGEYCRTLERYLTRKNDGHLVRIAGPAFEQVCEWGRRGVPLGVAQHGIDRYCERYYAKGPQRRPVRIEFCEADVLDAFDQWRRAIGIPMSATAPMVGERPEGDLAAVGPVLSDGPERKESLPAHLDRAIAKLTVARAGASSTLDAHLDAVVRELDGMRGRAKGLRGSARDQAVARLEEIDRALLEHLRAHADAATLAQVEAEAEVELGPFRPRMLAEAYERSRRASVDRLLRERARLPVLVFR